MTKSLAPIVGSHGTLCVVVRDSCVSERTQWLRYAGRGTLMGYDAGKHTAQTRFLILISPFFFTLFLFELYKRELCLLLGGILPTRFRANGELPGSYRGRNGSSSPMAV